MNSVRIDREELARRHASIRASMVKEGLDLYLILSSPLRTLNVHYAGNYDLIGKGAVVVVPLDGEPTLWISEEWDLPRAANVSPIADIRYSEDLARTCGLLLRRERSAIAGLEWVGSAFAAELVAWAGKEVKNAPAVLDRAAHRKTGLEKKLIREAAALADTGFERAFEVLKVGMREFELAAEVEYAMRAAGAIDNFGLLSSGKHHRGIAIATDKRVEPGDLLIFEITPVRLNRNYSAQLCRTMSIGPASGEIREKYSILEEALEAALQLIRPGTLVSDITAAQDDVISKYGFGDYCKPPYMRARGHGFGVGRVDLSHRNHQPLEEDMAMIVHPNQYFPDVGYLALGEMVFVTRDGVERLSRLPANVYERI